MADWHPYGNPNAKGEPGHKSMQRAEALRAPEKPAVEDWAKNFDYEAHEKAMEAANAPPPAEELDKRKQEKKEAAEKKLAFIKDHLDAGRTVYVQTPLRTTVLKKKHADMIRLSPGGTMAQMQQGKNWGDITHAKVTARDEDK